MTQSISCSLLPSLSLVSVENRLQMGWKQATNGHRRCWAIIKWARMPRHHPCHCPRKHLWWCGNASVTIIFRHWKWPWARLARLRALLWRFKIVTDSFNLWRFSVNRHGSSSMTLNPWRYLKPSQMLYSDDFLLIHDENFSSRINRFLVVMWKSHVRCHAMHVLPAERGASFCKFNIHMMHRLRINQTWLKKLQATQLANWFKFQNKDPLKPEINWDQLVERHRNNSQMLIHVITAHS